MTENQKPHILSHQASIERKARKVVAVHNDRAAFEAAHPPGSDLNILNAAKQAAHRLRAAHHDSGLLAVMHVADDPHYLEAKADTLGYAQKLTQPPQDKLAG